MCSVYTTTRRLDRPCPSLQLTFEERTLHTVHRFSQSRRNQISRWRLDQSLASQTTQACSAHANVVVVVEQPISRVVLRYSIWNQKDFFFFKDITKFYNPLYVTDVSLICKTHFYHMCTSIAHKRLNKNCNDRGNYTDSFKADHKHL
jgi:hypothetical protein